MTEKKGLFVKYDEYNGEKYNYEPRWLNITLALLLICVIGWNVNALYWTNYNQGIPATHQGSVIYIQHRYDKWNNIEWTEVEMLTFSGDTHHVHFWGHVDLETGISYKIHTVRDIRRMRMFPYEMLRMETIAELEILD